jgi:fusaric acid resistance family protein
MSYLSTLCTAVAAALAAATAAAGALLVPPLRDAVQPLVVTAVLVAMATGWVAQTAPRAVRFGREWVPVIAVLVAVLDVLMAGPLGPLGAVAFVLAAAAAAGMRRSGGRPAAVAVLAAGPLAAGLAAPPAGLPASAAPVAVVVVAGVVGAAVAWTLGVRALARRLLPPPAPPAPRRPRAGRVDVARAAGASGLGLAAAFAVAGPLFPAHATWVPLTAFVVGAGSVTWNDSARRGVLRLAGATAGAVLAALALLLVGPPVAVPLAVLALLVGAALRASGYAWWAGGFTAALVLLAGGPGGPDAGFVLDRVGAVLVGGALAIIAARLVLPPAGRPAPN